MPRKRSSGGSREPEIGKTSTLRVQSPPGEIRSSHTVLAKVTMNKQGSWTSLEEPRNTLLAHPLYALIQSTRELQVFMPVHAFAVWDFMNLVKRLQCELAPAALPWFPPHNSRLARFVNQIVLEEETDLDQDGAPRSHFEIYINAMEQVGADTSQVQEFVASLEAGTDLDTAARDHGLDDAVRDFVMGTLDVAVLGTPLEVAACFLFGREDIIPEMFRAILEDWPEAEREAPALHFYLQRHIELDGDDHGVLARQMLEEFSQGASGDEIDRAVRMARTSIERRIALWDAVLDNLRGEDIRGGLLLAQPQPQSQRPSTKAQSTPSQG